ncbi:MAG: SDR family oxidoreductase [Myxococcales bacterium]|nr:SDR family oxidoreductase [Myxococcales bacterium]
MTIHSSVAGKVCIVTGANTGIGLVTATELAAGGATVVLACRSQEKTAPVIAHIRKSTANQNVEFLALDLADFDSVRNAAKSFVNRGLPLDILINNAGLAGSRGVTASGFELHFGTNHLGHFMWTMLLKDALLRAQHPRVVHVASRAHYKAPTIDFEAVRQTTQSRTGFPEYCVSKLANVCFNIEFARRTANTSIRSYALHPGVVASDIWRKVPFPLRTIAKWFMISNEEGAQTSLYCATSPAVADHSGKYYDRSAVKTHARQATEPLAAQLWQKSVEWTRTDWS